MRRLPRKCVVDASVGIKLFVAEELSEHVQGLFRGSFADSDASIHVPDLFYAECANILWKKARKAEFPSSHALKWIAHLKVLAVHPTPTAELVERALEIALEFNISAYDACYVALAEMVNAPLVTADSRLASALRGSGCAVVVVGGT